MRVTSGRHHFNHAVIGGWNSLWHAATMLCSRHNEIMILNKVKSHILNLVLSMRGVRGCHHNIYMLLPFGNLHFNYTRRTKCGEKSSAIPLCSDCVENLLCGVISLGTRRWVLRGYSCYPQSMSHPPYVQGNNFGTHISTPKHAFRQLSKCSNG